jgi:methionyl aminopeptidase
MTVSNDEDLRKLQAIGRIVAQTLEAMGAAIQPGMTTAELDALGRRLLDRAGARSAPELVYDFPGSTCISVNEEVAHGIPGSRLIEAGDLVNIDVRPRRTGSTRIREPPSRSRRWPRGSSACVAMAGAPCGRASGK